MQSRTGPGAQRWINLWTVIILAIMAAIIFPLLDLLGIEIKSVYIVATSVVLGILAGVVIWRFFKGLFTRRDS